MSDIDDQGGQAEGLAEPKRRFDWSLNNWPNRLVYSLIAGTVVNLAVGSRTLGTVVAVVLFVLTTAIVGARRG
jgi:tetrahydromethanopterin S-methyltransferase subunit B